MCNLYSDFTCKFNPNLTSKICSHCHNSHNIMSSTSALHMFSAGSFPALWTWRDEGVARERHWMKEFCHSIWPGCQKDSLWWTVQHDSSLVQAFRSLNPSWQLFWNLAVIIIGVGNRSELRGWKLFWMTILGERSPPPIWKNLNTWWSFIHAIWCNSLDKF